MCFAPRYINGPIAAPLIDCRNSASLPDTAGAVRTDEQTTIISIAVAPIARLFLRCMPRLLSFTGAGAPPPARTDADASPRIPISSVRHRRWRPPPAFPALPAPPALPALPAPPAHHDLEYFR